MLADMRTALFQNATVIDGESDEPHARWSVLTEGERIAAVGPVDEVRAPDGAHVIDCTGRTVTPGLIDCHFHGAYQAVSCWEDYDLRRSIEHATLLAARNAQTLLEAGFTSVRDVGTRGLIAIALRDMIDAGVILGPRLSPGGRIISSTGGLADGYGHWIENRASLGHIVDGVEAVVKAVREQVKYGVTNIKLEASGTGISPFSDSRKQTLTFEEIAAAVKEAHRNNVRVACHAQATEGIKNAVRAGVDTIEHGSFLDEEGADLMLEHGTTLIPTISVIWLYVNEGPNVGVPQWVVDKFAGDLVEHRQSVELALDRGIPMAVGSDSGHSFNPQSIIAMELELMVEWGFTPMHTMKAATSIAARAIGREAHVGRLAPGLYADLLVLDSNPIDSMKVFRAPGGIRRVVKGGRLVAGAECPRIGEIELGYDIASDGAAAAGGADDAVDRPCCLKSSDELGR